MIRWLLLFQVSSRLLIRSDSSFDQLGPALAATATVFSLHGKGLKFDSVVSIQEHIDELNGTVELEEIRLGGNTLGVEACAAVAQALSTKPGLKVSTSFPDH